jgi:predicted DNA-binding transcriptional regulator AlpA
MPKTQDRADLSAFDTLPALARVRLPFVAGLYGVSEPTIWRWAKEGRIPSPSRHGGASTWQVGELRQHLANPSQK